jgi:hypothetical protein
VLCFWERIGFYTYLPLASFIIIGVEKGLIRYGNECNVMYVFTLKRQVILKVQEEPHFHVVYTIQVFRI